MDFRKTILATLLMTATSFADDRPPVVLTDAAKKLHSECLLIDGHNDLPWQYRERNMPSFEKFDIAQPQPKIHTDIPRLRKGGVGGQFWSVFVPSRTMKTGESLQMTLEQIDLVHRMIKQYPDTFELATTADDVERIHKAGKIASLIGMEGGHSIENSLNALRQLHRRGARYMTITHSATLDWADSATDEEKNNGLTAFGEEVVAEMNRLGMLVDISHVSPTTMKHVLRITKAPVIFSHSSARAIADHVRNVPDDVLELTAKNRGVVMVNFYSGFITVAAAERGKRRTAEKERLAKELQDEEKEKLAISKWEKLNPIPTGSIHDVVDHIDHIVKIAGIDSVGIGADYDGVDAVPTQLEDVSTYPLITQELLNRDYKPSDIKKIMGGNVLRAMREVEHAAAELKPTN